jgi:serine O-acetyltransferase
MTNGEEGVREALAFIQSCACATPLRQQADHFEPDRVGPSDPLRESLAQALESFRSDLDRWSLRFGSPVELFEALALAPNLQATFFYRASRALFLAGVKRTPDLIATVSRQLTGIEIYYSAEIGPGIKIIHGTGTVIGAKCTIGSAFTVYQNVTIGDKLGRQTGGRPVVGDRVIASAGAQILGPVHVGSETVVGANAVVLDSLPDRCVAAGVPARVVAEGLSDARFGEFWDSIKG